MPDFSADTVGFFMDVDSSRLKASLKDSKAAYESFVKDLDRLNNKAVRSVQATLDRIDNLATGIFSNLPQHALAQYNKAVREIRRNMKPIQQTIEIVYTTSGSAPSPSVGTAGPAAGAPQQAPSTRAPRTPRTRTVAHAPVTTQATGGPPAPATVTAHGSGGAPVNRRATGGFSLSPEVQAARDAYESLRYDQQLYSVGGMSKKEFNASKRRFSEITEAARVSVTKSGSVFRPDLEALSELVRASYGIQTGSGGSFSPEKLIAAHFAINNISSAVNSLVGNAGGMEDVSKLFSQTYGLNRQAGRGAFASAMNMAAFGTSGSSVMAAMQALIMQGVNPSALLAGNLGNMNTAFGAGGGASAAVIAALLARGGARQIDSLGMLSNLYRGGQQLGLHGSIVESLLAGSGGAEAMTIAGGGLGTVSGFGSLALRLARGAGGDAASQSMARLVSSRLSGVVSGDLSALPMFATMGLSYADIMEAQRTGSQASLLEAMRPRAAELINASPIARASIAQSMGIDPHSFALWLKSIMDAGTTVMSKVTTDSAAAMERLNAAVHSTANAAEMVHSGRDKFGANFNELSGGMPSLLSGAADLATGAASMAYLWSSLSGSRLGRWSKSGMGRMTRGVMGPRLPRISIPGAAGLASMALPALPGALLVGSLAAAGVGTSEAITRSQTSGISDIYGNNARMIEGSARSFMEFANKSNNAELIQKATKFADQSAIDIVDERAMAAYAKHGIFDGATLGRLGITNPWSTRGRIKTALGEAGKDRPYVAGALYQLLESNPNITDAQLGTIASTVLKRNDLNSVGAVPAVNEAATGMGISSVPVEERQYSVLVQIRDAITSLVGSGGPVSGAMAAIT